MNIVQHIEHIAREDKARVNRSLNEIREELMRLQLKLIDVRSINKISETRKFIEMQFCK